MLTVENLACGYNEYGKSNIVIDNISFSIDKGEIACVLGPNGIGKSTLFKGIMGLLKIYSGSIYLDGIDIRIMNNKELAKKIAYVPQARSTPFPYTVMEVVVMGRTAYLEYFSSPDEDDYYIAGETIEELGISHLADKKYSELSGGEKQLVLIARALTQKTSVLIMDEPTSNLDFGNQIKVLKYIDNLSAEGKSILMSTHYPDHAFLCKAKVAIIKGRDDFVWGTADEIITDKMMFEMYGIKTKIITAEFTEGTEVKTVVPML